VDDAYTTGNEKKKKKLKTFLDYLKEAVIN
jgi:DNA primase